MGPVVNVKRNLCILTWLAVCKYKIPRMPIIRGQKFSNHHQTIKLFSTLIVVPTYFASFPRINFFQYVERDIREARQIWRRACMTHLRYKPTIHWHWGCFEDRYPSDLDNPPTLPVFTCLDILTDLEARLTDSALVCCRRADAMRRSGKPVSWSHTHTRTNKQTNSFHIFPTLYDCYFNMGKEIQIIK